MDRVVCGDGGELAVGEGLRLETLIVLIGAGAMLDSRYGVAGQLAITIDDSFSSGIFVEEEYVLLCFVSLTCH